MPAAGYPFAVVPVVAMVLIGYAVRPRPGTAVAPRRLAAIRAALVTGGFAVLTVEILGASGLLTPPAFALAWTGFLIGAVTLAGWRGRGDRVPAGGSAAAWPAGRRAWSRASWPAGRRAWSRASWPAVQRAWSTASWPALRQAWSRAGTGERLLAGTVAGLVGVELVIALIAEPNNFDSQTYHLPKIEHWVAQRNLEFWPTAIHRQVTIPPGAEYLLLHLRLLSSGDALYNLVQWAAGIGCLLVASRIAAQLGGGRRAQLLTAFLVAATPMVALQATSTQTDLVVAAWAGCVATLALDGLTRPATAGSVLALGTATGLTAVTKSSGLIGAGPLLLYWGIAQLRLARRQPADATRSRPTPAEATRSRPTPADATRTGPVSPRGLARAVGCGLGVLLVAAAFTGPFLARVTAEFGHPLGPPRLRESIPMQRHDPGSVLVNGLRIGHTALDTPVGVLRDATAGLIGGVADLIGVDPQDRATTFGRTTWPVRSWYPDEDRVAFPLTGWLVLIGGLIAVIRPRRITPERPVLLRWYAVAVGAALLLHATMIKWQPWGNRLLLYALVLAVPVAGLWLDALFRHRAPAGPPGRRSVAALAAVTVLATCALSGVLAISYGFPRRLVGTGSLLTTGDWDTRFLRRPHWAEEFRWAAAAVRASGARRVGLVQQNDNWEYPWWLLLRDGSGASGPSGDRGPEIVALQSVLPDRRPPADPASVDAIVCTGDQAACARLVPEGWRLEFRDYVGYALPAAD